MGKLMPVMAMALETLSSNRPWLNAAMVPKTAPTVIDSAAAVTAKRTVFLMASITSGKTRGTPLNRATQIALEGMAQPFAILHDNGLIQTHIVRQFVS